MPVPQQAPAPACYRNPASPADQALTTIITMLAAGGYSFSIPSWDGDAYLRIDNALQALTDLTITSLGHVTWEYRSSRYPHTSERRLAAVAIELLDPDHARPTPAVPPDHLKLTPLGAARHALACYGLTATITQTGTDTGPIVTATNPAQPCRGTITITSDGELTWNTRAPHHPDGGIPLPDIATAITRALTRAEHPATRPQHQDPSWSSHLAPSPSPPAGEPGAPGSPSPRDEARPRGRPGRKTCASGQASHREQLRAACTMLSGMGMEAFAERARRELLATGETVRKRTIETLDELTPQEVQVVRLAASGQTNPQIGSQLFLSPRTVEWHLSKVFGKLGVSSRNELQAALPALGTADFVPRP